MRAGIYAQDFLLQASSIATRTQARSRVRREGEGKGGERQGQSGSVVVQVRRARRPSPFPVFGGAATAAPFAPWHNAYSNDWSRNHPAPARAPHKNRTCRQRLVCFHLFPCVSRLSSSWSRQTLLCASSLHCILRPLRRTRSCDCAMAWSVQDDLKGLVQRFQFPPFQTLLVGSGDSGPPLTAHTRVTSQVARDATFCAKYRGL